MTVSNVFVLQGFSTATAGAFYSQLESLTLNPNVEDLTVTPAGHTIPLFTAVNGSKPQVQFATHQLATVIADLGLLGIDPGVVTLFYRKVANRASRVADGTTSHISYVCNSVLGYLTQITAGANKAAVASGQLCLLNDGTNDAMIYSGGATITGAETAAENYVLGPIAHNGTAISGVDNMTCDFGIELIEPEQEILHEPTFAAVDKSEPVITFDTTDQTIWSQHETAITNSFKVNLIKKEAQLDRELDAATEHILLNVLKGRIVCESVSGNRSLTKVKVHCVSDDDVVAPVTATVGSAVSIAA